MQNAKRYINILRKITEITESLISFRPFFKLFFFLSRLLFYSFGGRNYQEVGILSQIARGNIFA